MSPEPFVSAEEAARFLSVSRRYLLTLARKGISGAYALGTGAQRKIWVFRLSELATAIAGDPQNPQTVRSSRQGNLHEEDQDEMKVLLPEQVISLLERLPYPVKIAVLLVASTGVRISECLGLTWKHVEWANNRIFIHQTFRRGAMQNRTKTTASHAPVPMCDALAAFLADWRQQTPYDKDEDFVFASSKLKGKQPLWGQTMNADFVKPAVVALGLVAKGESFGWHRFRHSLSTWANETTKDITVSQTLLRHSKPEMTAVYTHGNFPKALDAQRQYMEQLLAAKPASEAAQ